MGGNAVAVLAVIKPLSFIFQAVGTLADPEARAFVVLPLTHVGLSDTWVQLVILEIKRKSQFSLHWPFPYQKEWIFQHQMFI